MDFDDLERSVDSRTRMIVLCNPHNPVGRVYTEQELARIADIALRHDLLIFSDEIHADIVFGGRRHIPFASIDPEIAKRTITGLAPSKTFNIAGLKASVIVISNNRLKADFDYAQERVFGLYNANTFAIRGLEAAYACGDEWLEQLLPYLEENARTTISYLEKETPEIRVTRPEGTFLLWLDFGSLGHSQEELKTRLHERGRIALNDGNAFRPNRAGFMRLNIGCPRPRLLDGLGRLKEAVQS
ncbi:MAG: aminotransferase class I/II-fold pyridoxal phosphate-dependent enzyme [Candidatus Competibacteraceae bacterium]|nr:aminotransferase class I/II-fold pyridoxal phosphate-dependent enzyme [Candidatus Competibacteraceae bacterium]